MDERALDYHDVLLRKSDVQLLRSPSEWLNDQVGRDGFCSFVGQAAWQGQRLCAWKRQLCRGSPPHGPSSSSRSRLGSAAAQKHDPWLQSQQQPLQPMQQLGDTLHHAWPFLASTIIPGVHKQQVLHFFCEYLTREQGYAQSGVLLVPPGMSFLLSIVGECDSASHHRLLSAVCLLP